MRVWRNVVLSTVAGALLLLAGIPALAAVREPVPGLPVYLALGDSWAYGIGATDPATEGYVPQLLQVLRSRLDCRPGVGAAEGCKQLRLVNLAVPRATTPGVTDDQLPVARPLLRSRNGDRNPRNDVEVVTLHVGGNDVIGPIRVACLGGLTQHCLNVIKAEFDEFEVAYHSLLSALRAAAGPDAVIVVGTYGNPVPFCNLGTVPGAAQLGALVLEGSAAPVPEGLHDIIRRVADDNNASVAEVFTVLDEADDFVGGTDCLHPDDSGYDKVTSAFEGAIFG